MGLLSANTIGTLGAVTSFTVGIGGAESNVAIAVARLGGSATWVGRLGNDALGRLVVERVSAAGVKVHAIHDPSYTGIMVRHRRTGQVSAVDYHRRASAGSQLRPEDITAQMIEAANVVHLTGITAALSSSARETVFKTVELATEMGVPVSFDVNYRSKLWSADEARTVLSELISHSTIVFAGVEEAQLIGATDEQDRTVLARALSARGPAEVIVKDGVHGCCAVIDGELLSMPAKSVDTVVDPVGAGDAFAAGYLVERISGREAHACLDLATAIGAYAVTVPGDCELLPTREELAAAMAASSEVLR